MSEVVVNQAGIAALLRGPEIGKDLARRAIRVHNAAKRFCPVDSGRLQSSINWRLASDAQGPYAVVGTDVVYAIYVEMGTRGTEDHPGRPAQPYLRPALAEGAK